jgi:hypothetical protein
MTRANVTGAARYNDVLATSSRAALALASIGVAGEIIVLRHLLVDCYPYKMLTYPPSQFYWWLGNGGGVAILAVMLLFAELLSRRAPLLVPAAATALTPLVFLATLLIATHVGYGWTVPPGDRNFDGYTVTAATSEFVPRATELARDGVIVGGGCAVVLWVMRATRSWKRRNATAARP